MLTGETRNRLGELFHSVAVSERSVEDRRLTLAETPSFSPIHLFSALDVS
jgi:hypothetical protein